jgi:hypothetical protein
VNAAVRTQRVAVLEKIVGAPQVGHAAARLGDDDGPGGDVPGREAQLEKAVEWCLEELKKNPPKEYKRPVYPNYQKGTGLGKP